VAEKMLVGIHPNLKYRKLGYETQRFVEILRFNKIDIKIISANDNSFWDTISKCNLFIFQWTHHDYYRQIARTILPIIENHLHIKCFPNFLTNWLYDDKAREFYLLKVKGFPVIDSRVLYESDSAFKFIEQAEFPLVFKLKSGAGSGMVRLVKNKKTARRYINLMFKKGVSYKRGLPDSFCDKVKKRGLVRTLRIKLGEIRRRVSEYRCFYEEDWQIHRNYIIFQKFLPENAFDTRVVIIGNRAFAFRRYNRPGDFRASGSNLNEFDQTQIDLNFIQIAFQVSKDLGFVSMAYDFIYDSDMRPAIIEISYVFGSTLGSKISDCPGYWDDKLNWHQKRMEASYCILSELLKRSDLKIP
jgi:hypothetical protein